jgi:hypothetical protein
MLAVNFFTANTSFANGGALGVGNNPGGTTPVYSITQRKFTIANNVPVFGTSAQPPYGAFAVSQDLKLPYVVNFNVNVEQQVGPTTIVQVGYVGTRGHRLALMRDINAPAPSATGLSQSQRPFAAQYPGLAAINELETIGSSTYNSLQVSLIQNNWHGLSGRLNYTLGHAMDNGSEARNTLPMNSANIDADWGNASFDVRHVVSAGFTYSLPSFTKSQLGDGWQFNVISTIQSGGPFNVTTGTDVSETGVPPIARIWSAICSHASCSRRPRRCWCSTSILPPSPRPPPARSATSNATRSTARDSRASISRSSRRRS